MDITKKMIKDIYIKSLMLLISMIVFTSCSDIIEEPDISQDKVVIIAPAHQTVVKGNVVSFTWEPVIDADSYLLQVASPDFNQASQVYVDSLMPTTSFTKELLPNDYQWRIKAINSAYETAYTYSSFSVRKSDGFEGNTVLLSNPINNFATNKVTVGFTWDAIEDAVKYQIQVIDASEAIIADQLIENATSVEITLIEGDFKWQVRAINSENENTLYSSRNLLVDLTKPNTPQLQTPANESTEDEGEVTFTWERENISGSVERDSIFIYNDKNQFDLNVKGLGVEKNFKTTMEVGSYYWKVKSYDGTGNVSDDSSVFELTIN